MLYAVIRSGRDAFHFYGEVSGYNLQTLGQHVRHTLKEEGAVHLRLELDAGDHAPFERQAAKWLPRLVNSGVSVELVTPDGVRHFRRADPPRQVA